MPFDVTEQLEILHTDLKEKFAINEDVLIAESLQNFLNFVIYDSEFLINSSNNLMLNDLLTKELAMELRKDPVIMRLGENEQLNANEAGSIGEEGFAAALERIIMSEIEKLEDAARQAVINKLKEINYGSNGTKSIFIVGESMSTTKISNNLSQDIIDIIKNKMNMTTTKEGIIRTYARQGKNDIDTSSFSMLAELLPKAQSLIGLTASVKNYKGFLIKLEKLNAFKAYFAIMDYLVSDDQSKLDEQAVEEIFKQYYNNPSMLKSNPRITAHFNHFSYIYALTGIGQYTLDKDTEKMILNQYSRFLFYNNRQAKKIIIKSTRDIVNQLLEDPSVATGFYMSRSGKVKYLLEH